MESAALLLQSAEVRQRFPLSHFTAQVPPQSISVSPWFLMPSLQDGPAAVTFSVQILFIQEELAQSAEVRHAFPNEHFVLQIPPQSTSDSPIFFILSAQVVIPEQAPSLHQLLS